MYRIASIASRICFGPPRSTEVEDRRVESGKQVSRRDIETFLKRELGSLPPLAE